MTALAERAERRRREWVCGECSVSVRMEDGGLIDRPNGWDADDRCVACQRKRIDKEEGSDGVLRFDLSRGVPLKKAAKRAHVTLAVARSTRAGMVRRGEIEPPRKQRAEARHRSGRPRGRWSPHREGIEQALRTDPARQDAEIAKKFGVGLRTVMRARKRLGLPAAPTDRERDADTLRALGPATTAEAFADRIGTQNAGARKRLRDLLAAGLADVTVAKNGRKLYTAKAKEREG
jgi:hypothetical protein